MASSGMLRGVALVRTDVSEELSASIIRVFKSSVRRLLVTANVVPSSLTLVTLMMGALSSSETSVHTRAMRSNIPEDTILFINMVGATPQNSYRDRFKRLQLLPLPCEYILSLLNFIISN
jgi:hypothetical protein